MISTAIKWAVLASAFAGSLAACGAPEPGPKVTPAEPESEAIMPTDTATHCGATALDVPVSNLRGFDWDQAVLPGGVCGVKETVHLNKGVARATSDTWGPVTVAMLGAKYGQLLADRGVEAAATVYCDNGGGTGSSTLEYAVVVYSARGGVLTGVGLISAKKHEEGELPTILSVKSFQPSALAIRELYYRPADSTCCPSGRAVTTWTWAGDTPEPSAPHVLR